jgi:hypothetical protein
MQTFTFNGHEYTAPDQIGIGTVQLYNTILRRAFIAENPQAVSMGAIEKSHAFQTFMVEYSESYDNLLAILKLVLTPAPGSPDVETSFKALQNPAELTAVTDFFTEAVQNLTATPLPSPKSSKSSTKGGRAR